MSLVDVLPKVQELSELDKIRLIRYLARELERQAGALVEPGKSYSISSPDRAFGAAATLLQALEDDKGQPWLSRPSSSPTCRATRPSARQALHRSCR